MKDREPAGDILIDAAGARDFRLSVRFDGQCFTCGSFISRVAALQAGRLFLERKAAESEGRKKRPRRK